MMDENNIQPVNEKKKPKGFIDARKVRGFAFFVITLCVLLGIVVSILAIWNFAQKDVLFRTLATLGVVILGCLLFSIINDRFGD